MHQGRVEGVTEAVLLDVAPVHRVGEKIDEVGVGVVVGVGGDCFLTAICPFLVAQGHTALRLGCSAVALTMAATAFSAAQSRPTFWSQSGLKLSKQSSTYCSDVSNSVAAFRSRSGSKSKVTDCPNSS